MGIYTANQTTQDNRVEEIVNANQLEEILNTSAAQVSSWCQKACLKPKKDGFGNVYFSKSDIDVLKKVKELYEHTRSVRDVKREKVDRVVKRMKLSEQEDKMRGQDLDTSVVNLSEGNFLTRAKSRYNKENAVASIASYQALDVGAKLENLENNIVSKITDVLSEKMDGLDEVIVELIRSKTENEALRQRLNELNKENFSLKNENASYKPVGLGLYIKKSTDDFVL